MFTLIKHSTIQTTSKSPNQCKDVGHELYDYHVRLSVDSKLDEFGFVIDHSILHGAVKSVFDEQMGSCEQLALRSAQAIFVCCYLHKVNIVTIEVTIKPTNGTAYVIYQTTKNQLDLWKNQLPLRSTT